MEIILGLKGGQLSRLGEVTSVVDEDEDYTSDGDKLDNFVHHSAASVIDGGMVLRSIIIFQYLDKTGVLKNGILHHNTISNDEAIAVVVSTAKNFADNDTE